MLTLSRWACGIKMTAASDASMFTYFWFYEWNLFGAIEDHPHTGGKSDFDWQVAADTAAMSSENFAISAAVHDDTVDLTLTVTNTSKHTWPDIAAVIPCFNPGNGDVVEQNPRLTDREHVRTWYVGTEGLDRLVEREIHFNHQLRPDIDAVGQDGEYVFSHKWPTAPTNATRGAIIRQSSDDRWVAAIAWDDFISAQGHNPWDCMHLSVRVGPLAPGDSITRRGRIVLFEGTPEEALARCGAVT